MSLTDTKATDVKAGRIFHALSAGSTTIMPDGTVIRFGGQVEKQDHGVKVGKGTYIATDKKEISWLESCSKMSSPQIWEEVASDVADDTPPVAVATTIVADITKAADEVKERAVTSTSPAVIAAIERANKITSDAVSKASQAT